MADEQRAWDEGRRAAKEESWTDEDLSGDDLSMGETGRGLRQEQWEEVSGRMVKGEDTKMAEQLGEELGGELRDYWRRERIGRKVMDNMSHWRKRLGD